MNIKKIITFSVTAWALFFSCLNQSVFSASWNLDQKLTIREMQEDIQMLQQEKSLLEFKWKTFQIWNFFLWDLLKENLSILEREQLSFIVESYNRENIQWEKILQWLIDNKESVTDQRKDLLLLKRDFYNSLLPFVAEGRKEEFIMYIWSDLSLNEKSKDVDSQIQKIQNSKQERVQQLQIKIEDNNRLIRENIEKRISTEVKEKLDIFVNETDFSRLSNTAKKNVFDRLIKKLEYESIRLTNLRNSTSVIEEKIIVFRVVINLLKEYTINWTED